MAERREVFQSKVLQKLYPPRKPEKEPSRSPPPITKKTHVVKRKTSGEDALHGKEASTANRGRRLYTALPPPLDFNIQPQESVTLPQLHSINSAEGPADEERVQEHNEDSDEDTEEEEEHKQRRRRKKRRKSSLQLETGKDGAASGSQTPADEGGEHMSKNKKRKLKKKRHKEKLLSLGLMPRAAAVEFTYQKDAEEEEKQEDYKRRAAEVSDFLRTTMEIYMSDSSLHAGGVPELSATVDELLESLAAGGRPSCVLRQLYHLKAFVQHCEADELGKALKELSDCSVLSAEETAAVVSLFQYWITDILPMQGDKKAKLPTTHP